MSEIFRRCLKQIAGPRMILNFENLTYQPTRVAFNCPVCNVMFALEIQRTGTGIYFECMTGCNPERVFEKLSEFGIACSVNSEQCRSAMDYPEIVSDLERMLALPAYKGDKK